MKQLILFVMALLITGCVCHPKTRDILVPCKIPTLAEPAWSFDEQSSASLFDDTRDLLVDREQHMHYETQLKAAIEACR